MTTVQEEVIDCLVESITSYAPSPTDIDPQVIADRTGVSRRTVISTIRLAIKRDQTYAGHHLKEVLVKMDLTKKACVMFRIIDPA